MDMVRRDSPKMKNSLKIPWALRPCEFESHSWYQYFVLMINIIPTPPLFIVAFMRKEPMPQGEKKVQIGGCRIRTVGTLLNEVKWILRTPRASSNLAPPTRKGLRVRVSLPLK